MLYNADEIQEVIPHRYPMLLVDGIKYISPKKDKIVGVKAVTSNEMYFMGHFPQKKVMPGVLIVEALAQTGCFLLLSKEENKGKIAYFAGINKVRFKKQVIPGDLLELEVIFIKQKGGIYFATIKASVNEELAVTGEIMCALG